VSAELDTTVTLADISNGSDDEAVIDVQGRTGSDQGYVGSVAAELPRRDGGPIEM
jgi:hypothetical protein